ncbi:MAG: DUF2971 domain-containing protein [Clostridia bacterium]|nr:DUF2971 domain-containing protein [Clostridia bacterium]
MEPQQLFHYCSTEAAFNILKTRSLRLCDISKSNDSAELILFYPLLFDALRSAYAASPFEFAYRGESGARGFGKLVGECEDLVNWEMAEGSLTNYVFSLSEHGDMLSQWRGYANDSKGVSLGFSFQALKDFADDNELFSFARVQYIFQSDVERLAALYAGRILDETRRSLPGLSERAEPGDLDQMVLFHAHAGITRTITESLRYKLNGFSEEREWRLFMTDSAFKVLENSFPELEKYAPEDADVARQRRVEAVHEHLDFFPADDDIVSYYTIPFEEFPEPVLCSIRLGANNFARFQDLKLMLRQFGIPGRVTCERSRITSYRRKQI